MQLIILSLLPLAFAIPAPEPQILGKGQAPSATLSGPLGTITAGGGNIGVEGALGSASWGKDGVGWSLSNPLAKGLPTPAPQPALGGLGGLLGKGNSPWNNAAAAGQPASTVTTIIIQNTPTA